MSSKSQAALHAALKDYVPGSDPGPLTEAAEAHLKSARPYEDIAAEYVPLTEPGAAPDPVAFSELAEELQAVRAASAVVSGALPGQPPAVSTSNGEAP